VSLIRRHNGAPSAKILGSVRTTGKGKKGLKT
jgi:hypothetical protein